MYASGLIVAVVAPTVIRIHASEFRRVVSVSQSTVAPPASVTLQAPNPIGNVCGAASPELNVTHGSPHICSEVPRHERSVTELGPLAYAATGDWSVQRNGADGFVPLVAGHPSAGAGTRSSPWLACCASADCVTVIGVYGADAFPLAWQILTAVVLVPPVVPPLPESVVPVVPVVVVVVVGHPPAGAGMMSPVCPEWPLSPFWLMVIVT